MNTEDTPNLYGRKCKYCQSHLQIINFGDPDDGPYAVQCDGWCGMTYPTAQTPIQAMDAYLAIERVTRCHQCKHGRELNARIYICRHPDHTRINPETGTPKFFTRVSCHYCADAEPKQS